MNSRRPTIDDVARLAGVSIKTVSRVFNIEPNVRPGTRDKVVAAAGTLNYRPNLSARRLASNQHFVVGMLYDNPNGDYITSVQSGALQVCRDHGYHLLINPIDTKTTDVIREVTGLRRQVDGFILLQPLSDMQELNHQLLEGGIHCVRISQRPFDGFPWVSVADTDAADEMTSYLIDIGHRRIGFIVGHPEHGQSHDRLAGYRRALERHGIEPDEQLVEQGLFDYESGLSCGRKLLSSASPPSAIFASNDSMATGVLSAAHEKDIDVPRDLSVAGFDDSPLARHARPLLTTVRQPIEEIAGIATRELMMRMKGQSEGDPHHCVRAELVRRASTASPRLRSAV